MSHTVDTVPRVGAAERLRSWGRAVRENPWLAVGVVAGLLLICAWIGWGIRVWSDHGASAGIGALIAWAAIFAVLALISIPFIWAFRVIRASRPGDTERDEEPEPTDAEATEPG